MNLHPHAISARLYFHLIATFHHKFTFLLFNQPSRMGYLLINSGRVTSTSDPNTVSTSRPPAANKLVPHVKTKPGTPYAGKLRFPSSDGDSNRWPTINTSVAPDDTHDFFRIDDFEANKKLSPMEQKHREEIVLKWKEKIGTYLGNKLKQTSEILILGSIPRHPH